jgi:hypothetical protein
MPVAIDVAGSIDADVSEANGFPVPIEVRCG